MKYFEEFQRNWSDENVEVERFIWLTENPIIRKLEIDLLTSLPIKEGFEVLEVGCGEGQNIANLGTLYRNVNFHGVDMSENRIAFAKKNLKDTDLRVQDGRNLDFEEDMFDLVFCRDVLHHMKDEREKFILAMHRVCKRGGRVVLIESNGMNIINNLFSLIVKKESEMKKITPGYMKKLLRRTRLDYRMSFKKGYNLQRLIFHYSYGMQYLAKFKIGQLIYDMINLIPIPEYIYSYLIIEIRK